MKHAPPDGNFELAPRPPNHRLPRGPKTAVLDVLTMQTRKQPSPGYAGIIADQIANFRNPRRPRFTATDQKHPATQPPKIKRRHESPRAGADNDAIVFPRHRAEVCARENKQSRNISSPQKLNLSPFSPCPPGGRAVRPHLTDGRYPRQHDIGAALKNENQ
jgi:hypothetical protein